MAAAARTAAPSPRRPLLFAGLAACATALAVLLWLRGDGAEPARPTTPGEAEARAPVDPIAANPGASTAEGAGSRAVVPSSPTEGRGETSTSTNGAAPPTGSVALHAFDVATEQPILSFTWTAVGTVRGIEPRGASQGAVARVSVPMHTDAAVVLEADGYFASLPVDVALRTGAFRELHVALVARPSSAAVRLVARDEFGQPVKRLQVRCRSRGAGGDRAYVDTYELASTAESGVHELPAPPEGWCRLWLAPRLESDGLRRFVPQEVEFRHASSRAHEQEVVFAAGGDVVVESREAISDLRLLDGLGRPVATPLRPDAASGAGSAWRSAEALPPGDYAVEFRLGSALQTRGFRLLVGQTCSLLLP